MPVTGWRRRSVTAARIVSGKIAGRAAYVNPGIGSAGRVFWRIFSGGWSESIDMQTRTVTRTCAAAALLSACLLAVTSEGPQAQSGGPPDFGLPPGVIPASTWKPSKLADGQPNVQGIYQAVGNEGGSQGINIEAMTGVMGSKAVTPGIVIDPPDKMIPYLPWARTRRDEMRDLSMIAPTQAMVDTRNRGWAEGVPRINYYGVPGAAFQILQVKNAVLILYEVQHEFRYIPLDGRPQVDEPVKLFMGSSRGTWHGNTLVVDVANINDRFRISIAGDFASDKLKVTEYWTWIDEDTIKHRATFTDPQVFTRPWTVAMTIRRLKDKGYELLEYSGVEGDKDAHLMVDIPAKK
jgi:hypothetical protein